MVKSGLADQQTSHAWAQPADLARHLSSFPENVVHSIAKSIHTPHLPALIVQERRKRPRLSGLEEFGLVFGIAAAAVFSGLRTLVFGLQRWRTNRLFGPLDASARSSTAI